MCASASITPARTGFEWRLTRQFALEGAYEYKWQKYEGDPTNATLE